MHDDKTSVQRWQWFKGIEYERVPYKLINHCSTDKRDETAPIGVLNFLFALFCWMMRSNGKNRSSATEENCIIFFSLGFMVQFLLQFQGLFGFDSVGFILLYTEIISNYERTEKTHTKREREEREIFHNHNGEKSAWFEE